MAVYKMGCGCHKLCDKCKQSYAGFSDICIILAAWRCLQQTNTWLFANYPPGYFSIPNAKWEIHHAL